jgi:uncharacterized phage infection (PIP) family protein YhgE
LSPLTKLFVILLVVLSLLLTAATVVFVSQVENYQAAATLAKQQLTAAQSERDRARADMDAVQASAQEAVKQASTQVEQAKQNMNSLQQMLVDRDTQLGQAKSQSAIQAADLTRLAEAMKASEDTKAQLQQQLADLRSGNDKFLQQNAQLNQTVTDLTNRLEVTERERKFLAEQLTEAKNQVDKQAGMLRDAGVSQAQYAAAGTRAGAPPINGVIKTVRPIAGIPYATISVGSADGVAKGMEFKIVNRDNGQFLGILTVDSVELNEATGRLSGEPQKVAQIRPGVEVKTQL